MTEEIVLSPAFVGCAVLGSQICHKDTYSLNSAQQRVQACIGKGIFHPVGGQRGVTSKQTLR